MPILYMVKVLKDVKDGLCVDDSLLNLYPIVQLNMKANSLPIVEGLMRICVNAVMY